MKTYSRLTLTCLLLILVVPQVDADKYLDEWKQLNAQALENYGAARYGVAAKLAEKQLAIAEKHLHEGRVDLTDPRIKIAAVFAPAIGPMFDRAGLAAVEIPILIFWAGRDEILNEPVNSSFYIRGIRNVSERPMSSIGHFGFLSTCSDLLRRYAAEICTDPPGTSRAAFHQTLLSELATFLDRHLMSAGR